MTVTVPVVLTAEEEAALAAQAKAQGVSVDSLLRKAVLQVLAAAPLIQSPEPSVELWVKDFQEWLDGATEIPSLSDEALSRESIYTREDEWG